MKKNLLIAVLLLLTVSIVYFDSKYRERITLPLSPNEFQAVLFVS